MDPEFDMGEFLSKLAGERQEPLTIADLQKKKEAQVAHAVLAKAANVGAYDAIKAILDATAHVPAEDRPGVLANAVAICMAEVLVIFTTTHSARKAMVKNTSKATMDIADLITDRFATANFNSEPVVHLMETRQKVEDMLETARDNFWRARFKANTKSD